MFLGCVVRDLAPQELMDLSRLDLLSENLLSQDTLLLILHFDWLCVCVLSFINCMYVNYTNAVCCTRSIIHAVARVN